jgi:hypothetical protein
MSATISPPPSPTSPSRLIESRLTLPMQVERRRSRGDRDRCETGYDVLGRYADGEGRAREVVALPGALESVLVVDRDANTLGDRRLVAHLASDEAAENAWIVCGVYLEDSGGQWSRPVRREDLETVPFAAEQEVRERAEVDASEVELTDRHGYGHRLEILAGERSRLWVRWRRHAPARERVGGEMVSVRDVIGNMESYEPVRSLTARTIAAYGGEPQVSVYALELELERVERSPFVLNRGLRERALAVLEGEGLSMSEIAIRCGRVKHDFRGRASGDSSWLVRRLGIMANFGESAPTPWIHSDVLAVIAREGLRISPREVELG